jgi:transcriptional regulator with XRE-family HTH domain
MPVGPKNPSPARAKQLARQSAELATARADAGLTQAAAAELFGVKLSAYLSYEHGKRQPRGPVRQAIAAAWPSVSAKALAAEALRCPHCGRHY